MCVKRKMVCFYHPFNVLEVATNSIIVAMNYTEIESKVREATNNEPWGAPTTLMAQIASATYNYREREEILAFIFRRFTEKAANEWRQIYKSLQLLDYLIKNGSERIIDDVRSNLSLIQMLKSFHYIDSKGRDQGINVRNRAKNLINLLNDDALIRSERKKARANQKKFGGVRRQRLVVLHRLEQAMVGRHPHSPMLTTTNSPIGCMVMVGCMERDMMIQLQLIKMEPQAQAETSLKNTMCNQPQRLRCQRQRRELQE